MMMPLKVNKKNKKRFNNIEINSKKQNRIYKTNKIKQINR